MSYGDFREYLARDGLSIKTIRIYLYRLAQIEDWCKFIGSNINELTALELARYVDSTPNSTSTRRHIQSTLTRYWAMTGRTDPPVGAVRVPPKPYMVCRALEEDGARRLAQVAQGWWPQGTAVLMAMYLAMRREEIAEARWDRFDGNREWYTVQGKGSVVATLPVHPALRRELIGRQNGTAYVFEGLGARDHVAPGTVWTWVRQVAEEAGLGTISPHVLRHTALATANDRTGNLRAVQTFARHARPETTAGYTRTTAARLQEVMFALDYLE
ncbi:MAG: tyrosine-type recombinase/integrase [Acidimicrobiia bacterium]|nr:tyrosine-type recombinase/integrase [Acidimicrobiia bacterium]